MHRICVACGGRSRTAWCPECKSEWRRLRALHKWYERQVCEAEREAKQRRLAELVEESDAMGSFQKYAARMKGSDELWSESEERMTAEIMGGEVPFGPSRLMLYAADLAFLARVRAAQQGVKLCNGEQQ